MNATSRPVQFRQVIKTGGDPLLGIGETITNVDTPVSPQPAVSLVSEDEVAASGGLTQLGDYIMIFSGGEPESTFQSRLILYGDDVLKVERYEPFALDGKVVGWRVLARAIQD